MPRVLRSPAMVEEQRWLPEPLLLPDPEPEPEPAPDLQVIAEEIRHAAQEEAVGMLDAARQEAEEIHRKAHEEGLAEGRHAGEHSLDEQLAHIAVLVDEINSEREAFFTRMEPELVRLATVIAEKVLAQQLSLKPEIVVDVARMQMKRIREREVIHLRVNPDDMPLLTEARPALLSEVDGVREICLFDDRRVSRGSVVIETKNGTLDARLPAQLDIVKAALNDALEATGDDQDS